MTTVETELPVELFNTLTAKLQLCPHDLLLIGDGSGTVVSKACGFACIAYDTKLKQYRIHSGSISHGTNNFAELMPYMHALWYDHYLQDQNISFRTVHPKRNVEIVSDSELTVKQGNKIYTRSANSMLWTAIDSLVVAGYNIHWNHVLRNTNELSTLCDKLAGKLRRKMLDS
jgi:ribonuclease HI